MNYIINPAWFYWANVADTLKVVSIVLFIISAVSLVISGIMALVNKDFGEEDNDYKTAKRFFKLCCVVLVAVGLLVVFIPDKKTLIEMQIARYATYENAEITIDTIKGAVDYIVEAMNQLK